LLHLCAARIGVADNGGGRASLISPSASAWRGQHALAAFGTCVIIGSISESNRRLLAERRGRSNLAFMAHPWAWRVACWTSNDVWRWRRRQNSAVAWRLSNKWRRIAGRRHAPAALRLRRVPCCCASRGIAARGRQRRCDAVWVSAGRRCGGLSCCSPRTERLYWRLTCIKRRRGWRCAHRQRGTSRARVSK